MNLVGVVCTEDSPVRDTPLRHLTNLFPDLVMTVLCIIRDNAVILPRRGANDEAGDGLRAIALEVSPETLEAHRIGGQYVQLTLGEEKPGFYAIASPPVVGPTEGKAFEFLIKENEGNAYLASLAAGAAVKCSDVSGGGYAVGKAFNGEDGAVDSEYDGFACMNQLFVAGGSGQGRTRVIQRRFNVSVPRARVLERASTLRDRSER